MGSRSQARRARRAAAAGVFLPKPRRRFDGETSYLGDPRSVGSAVRDHVNTEISEIAQQARTRRGLSPAELTEQNEKLRASAKGRAGKTKDENTSLDDLERSVVALAATRCLCV
jgi:hypothetical protein